MIKVNNKLYDNFSNKVSWGSFEATINGKKRSGMAPFISFSNDEFCFGLEFVFSDVMFCDTKLNIKTDISMFLSDITYDDENGWISLSDGECKCYITRVDECNFRIEVFVNNKYENNIEIELNEIVKIIN